MSEENVEAFKRGAEAYERRDLEAVLDGLDPEVEWWGLSALVEGGDAYHGHEGFRQFWADVDTAFDEIVTAFEEVRDVGDVVLGLGRIRLRSKQGVSVDSEYGIVIRYRDGLAVWG